MSVDRYTCPRCGAELVHVWTLNESPAEPACDNCGRLERRREAGVCRVCQDPRALGCDFCAKHCRTIEHARCSRAARRDYMRFYMRGYSQRQRRDRGAA